MALDFPDAPTVGQLFPSPPLAGIPQWQWDGSEWTTVSTIAGIADAPSDGTFYGRQNAAWVHSNLFSPTLQGDVPASGGGSANFLRADGTWSAPPGGAAGSSGQVQYNNAGALGGFTMGGDATLVASTGVLTIGAGAVTNAKLANMAASSIKGNNTGAAAAPIDLTAAQATAMLAVFTSTLQGLAPASGGGTVNFLRADGTWAAPPGAGSTTPGGTTGQVQWNNAGAFGGFTMGGDATLVASTGVLTIAAAAVTYPKMQNVAASRVLGNPTGSAAAPSEIVLGGTLAFSGTTLQTAALTGDVTAAANSFATTIAAGAVTNAKMANMAAHTYKGNNSGAGAAPADVTAANLLADIGAMALAGNQNVTGGFTFTAYNAGAASGTFTPSSMNGNYQYITNNAAFTLAAPTSDCAIDIMVTNGATAGAITFTGFTVGANTGDSLTTTNTSKFIISIRRINAVATYTVKALQ
jgi:hypothetical protein